MENESPNDASAYDIKLYPRGPASCEWKLWPKGGGAPKAQGVARSKFEAEQAAQKAIARLTKAS